MVQESVMLETNVRNIAAFVITSQSRGLDVY